MKADTYLKNFLFFFQGRGVWGHSKPTSWYKFAKRNTGLIVCGAERRMHTNRIPFWNVPFSLCMAQWLMYNKSTKGGFNTSDRDTVILSFFTVFNWKFSLKHYTVLSNAQNLRGDWYEFPFSSSSLKVFFKKPFRREQVFAEGRLKLQVCGISCGGEWNRRLGRADKDRLGKREVGSGSGSTARLRAVPTAPGVHLIQMILLFIDRGRVLKRTPLLPPPNHLQLNTDIILEI